MSITEALSEGLQTAVVGLGTVFAVLIILMIVLYVMKAIFYKEEQKKAPAAIQQEPENEINESVTEDNGIDEGELIAVLTAAVAASLNTSTYNLEIKSYRRIGNGRPAWNRAGVRETIDNRF